MMFSSILVAIVLVTNVFGDYVCPEGCIRFDPCGDDWMYYKHDKTCVLKVNSRMSFDDARSKCQDMDGDLITIKDLAKNNFVSALLDRSPAWIGAWDDNEDGAFTHVDGTGLDSFQRWNWGEPDNRNNQERCVSMIGVQNFRAGYWNDANCGNKYQFVCSKPINS